MDIAPPYLLGMLLEVHLLLARLLTVIHALQTYAKKKKKRNVEKPICRKGDEGAAKRVGC